MVRNKYFSVVSVLVISVGIYFLSDFIEALNSVMLGLLIGILFGNIVSIPKSLDEGLKYSGSKLLEVSIVLLAFGISASSLAAMGVPFLIKILIGVILVLASAILLNKLLKCDGTTGLLTGFGTAICGSSAVAAVAPLISEDKEDAGIAIAVVNLIGALGTFFLPALLSYISIGDTEKGFIIGGSLHAVGNVAGAGYAMNDYIGETAIAVKMVRIALLSPMVIFYSYFVNKGNGKGNKTSLNLPLYLWLFIGITVLTFFTDLPKDFVHYMKIAGKIFLTAAMLAIGLRLSLKRLYQSGREAFLYGIILFAAQLVIFGVLMVL